MIELVAVAVQMWRESNIPLHGIIMYDHKQYGSEGESFIGNKNKQQTILYT